jgi:hypothetical protein
LTGSEQFSLADLNGLISVRYLAMGWHKIVYVVDFHSGQNGCANTTVVIKTEKRLGSIPRDQISRQSQLVDSGVASVPRIGDISENGSGLAYFEEFIDGVPLNDLRRDGLVTLVLRGQILRTLLAVYGQLGAIPVGIRPKQWIVRHLDQNKPETVWVDLGGTTQSAAFEILDSVNLWYGSHGFILAPKPWPSFKFWKAFANHEKPDVDSRDQELEKNDMLFNTVVDVLGREKGALFLNQVLSRASRHWVAPRYKFRKGDFQHAFRGGFLTGIKRRIFRTLWMEAWQVRRQFEFFIFRRELTAYLKKSATLSLP